MWIWDEGDAGASGQDGGGVGGFEGDDKGDGSKIEEERRVDQWTGGVKIWFGGEVGQYQCIKIE